MCLQVQASVQLPSCAACAVGPAFTLGFAGALLLVALLLVHALLGSAHCQALLAPCALTYDKHFSLC